MVPIVSVSTLPVPPAFSVIARVVELLNEREAEVISPVLVKMRFGGADVLNSNPAGAFKTKTSAVPLLKLSRFALFTSSITIDPKVVHAGKTAFAALSAEILVPFVPGVITTTADEEIAHSENAPMARASRDWNHRAARVRHRAAGSRPAGHEQGSWEDRAPTLLRLNGS